MSSASVSGGSAIGAVDRAAAGVRGALSQPSGRRRRAARRRCPAPRPSAASPGTRRLAERGAAARTTRAPRSRGRRRAARARAPFGSGRRAANRATTQDRRPPINTPLRRSDHAARRRICFACSYRTVAAAATAAACLPPASASSASAEGTIPFSASFSIVSLSIRALRIRYQRMSAIASTGAKKTTATIATTIAASAGSSWTNSSKESNSRSVPSPSIVDSRALADRDRRARRRTVPAVRRILGIGRVARRIPMPSPLASPAFADVDLDLRAAPVGDRTSIFEPAIGTSAPWPPGLLGSWACTGGVRGTSASASPRKKAVPSTSRRTSAARARRRWRTDDSCGLP